MANGGVATHCSAQKRVEVLSPTRWCILLLTKSCYLTIVFHGPLAEAREAQRRKVDEPMKITTQLPLLAFWKQLLLLVELSRGNDNSLSFGLSSMLEKKRVWVSLNCHLPETKFATFNLCSQACFPFFFLLIFILFYLSPFSSLFVVIFYWKTCSFI